MYCEIFKGLFWFNFNDCGLQLMLRRPILRTLPLVCESAETHQRLDVDLHGDVVATEIGQEAET